MNPYPSLDPTRRARLWLLVALTVILAGWALHATAVFMVPVVFSVFLALIVAPLDRWVAERVPDRVGWLGHIAAMGAILLTLLAFVGLIWLAAQQVVERFPFSGDGQPLLPQFGTAVSDSDAVAGAAPEPESASGGFFGRLGDLLSGAGGSFAARLADWASGLATQILSAAGAILGATVLVFFLTLLMLIEGPRWQDKMANVLDAPARQDALESIGIIAARLRRYLLARAILGVITAMLYTVWLWFFGVDLLVVWALLAFLLNFIPTLGSLIAGALPVLYAFVQKDFGTAMAVGGGILVIEQVMGNYVDPRVQGRQVSLSSLVVLITLLVWGWVWGVAGAILAVPITIAAMIISAHVARLRPFALMLSDARDFDGLDRQASSSSR